MVKLQEKNVRVVFGQDYPYALCPCDSGKKAKFCCLRPGPEFVKKPQSIVPPVPITGYTHPRCYASADENCSSTISGEHTVSEMVLNELGTDARVILEGLSWQEPGTKKNLPTSVATKANVLCTRHNSALATLDAEVGRLFRTLRLFEEDFQRASFRPEFKLFCGYDVERWMLKTLCGLRAADHIRASRDGRPWDDTHSPVDILYGRQPWSIRSGLYLQLEPTPINNNLNAIVIATGSLGPDQPINVFRFQLRGLTFFLSTIDPGPGGSRYAYRPNSVFLTKQGVRKYVHFWWDVTYYPREIAINLNHNTEAG